MLLQEDWLKLVECLQQYIRMRAGSGKDLGTIADSHVAAARDYNDNEWGVYLRAAMSQSSSSGSISNSG